MKIRQITLLSAALSMATALGAAPPAGAQAKKEPDLATQRVTMTPQYVVVKPNGKTTHPISVTVSIRNIGHAAAPASETDVRLFSNGRKIANETIPLAPLAPGHASTQIALFPDAEPQLGFVEAVVVADSTNKVAGPTSNDVKRSPERPVIAERWTGVMESDVHTPGILGPTEDDHATTPQELTFTFSRRDAIQFVYAVGGTVNQTATFSGGRSGGCTGSGEGSGAMARWGGDSGLFISRDLTGYEATVRTSLASPFTVTWTCPEVPMPVTAKIGLKDLLTETSAAGGLVPMLSRQRVLHGQGHLGTMITIDYNWNLVADVP